MSALFAPLLLASFQVAAASQAEELTQKNYQKNSATKSVVVLQINWARHWGCAGTDSAQLESLEFSRLKGEQTSISLAPRSNLLAHDEFVPYALLIEPGEYALAGFDVKVVRSKNDVGRMVGSTATLFKEGKPIGGTFSAMAGEIVYIGHFGVDCTKEPVPWRYYIEGRAEFDRYAVGFRKRFPFIGNTPVRFRLFSTTMFGEPYSLD